MTLTWLLTATWRKAAISAPHSSFSADVRHDLAILTREHFGGKARPAPLRKRAREQSFPALH
jgi:hypothetical protein